MVSFEPLLGTVQSLIDARRLPGVALRIMQGDEIEVEAALGWRHPARREPLALDDIFRIYSMTKPITSVAVMMLVEAGLTRLDDPITRVFPEFSRLEVAREESGADGRTHLVRGALMRPPTVRDLLMHTAGLTYGSFGDSLIKAEYRAAGAERGDISGDELIRILAGLPLVAQPGELWEYSRATDVLGVLIERLSGMPLAQFFHERIFAPLGMADTFFEVPPQKAHRVVEPFDTDPDLGTAIRLRNPHRLAGYASGGGGLLSTLPDYQRFIHFCRQGGMAQGTRLLSAAHLASMRHDHLGQRPHAGIELPSDCGFGLGFAVRAVDSALGTRGDYYWSGLGGTFFVIDPTHDRSALWMMQAPNQRTEMRLLFLRLIKQSYDA